MTRSRGPRGRTVPPHDFCMACRKGDAGRAIVVRGDKEWMAHAFALLTGHVDAAEGIADAIWDTLPVDDALPAYKAYPIRLCRACARAAVKRAVAAGLHEPGVYNHARLTRGEYPKTEVKGLDQPKMVRLVGGAIDEMIHTQERADELAADGNTLCRHWNEEAQQWSVYVTSNPELIAEDEVKVGERLFPPAKLPGDPPGAIWWPRT
jgi:hypothetical protein